MLIWPKIRLWRRDSSPLQLPNKVQVVMNANNLILVERVCVWREVCVLEAAGVQKVTVEYSRETVVGDSSFCKVNRISS